MKSERREVLIRTTKEKYKFAISFSILECLPLLLNRAPAELSTKEYKLPLQGTARKLSFKNLNVISSLSSNQFGFFVGGE